MTEKKAVHDKPLDKMTVTELREVAKDLPDITGVHGMKKAELLAAVMKAMGGKEPTQEKSTAKPVSRTPASVPELKAMIKRFRIQRDQALVDNDKKKAKIYRRRISKLKKKTRQAA